MPPADPSAPGIPGVFILFIVLAIGVGIATTIWRVSVARRIATKAGLDPDDAGAAAFLTQNGLDATYVAAALAHRSQNTAPTTDEVPPHQRSTEERLGELRSMHARGVITTDEYNARRKDILDSV